MGKADIGINITTAQPILVSVELFNVLSDMPIYIGVILLLWATVILKPKVSVILYSPIKLP